jgi:RNA polymerase sigma-70 factor (ECF subfamily)
MDQADQTNDLVRRAVGGDTLALKLLLTESRDRLCEHLSNRVPPDLRPSLGVEDVVQEALLEVFRRIETFEVRGPRSFYRWVATIGLNRLRDAIRRERAGKRGGRNRGVATVRPSVEDSSIVLLETLAGPGRTPSRTLARAEAVEAVQAALKQLPEHYRRAIWLVHLESRPVREAAATMGRSERAIHGLCRRGLKLLEGELQSATRFLSSTG